MSYILEVILINRKEKLFYGATLSEEESAKRQEWYAGFLQSYIDKGYFVEDKPIVTDDIFQNEEGHWTSVKRTGFFKEREMATEFITNLSEDPVIYRKQARAWSKENSIAGEINILDSSEDIHFQQSNCYTGVCVRPDGTTRCPTGPAACHNEETGFKPQELKQKEHHIPLQSFVKFKNK
jgi:hypothetical protein